MTREEQIIEAADEKSRCESPYFYDAFIEGAKWADHTMIERACEWLQENCAIIWESPCNPDKVVEQFKKALKEL